MTNPKLRWPIDARIQSFGKEEALILQCPIGISPKPLALQPAISPVIATLDGTLSFEEILARFQADGLTRELLHELLETLDGAYLLDNDRFLEAQEKLKKEYSASPVRAAALAGLSYEADRESLTKHLSEMLAHSKSELKKGPLVGLMAPHIDYRRGGVCYGMTYSSLKNRDEDLYIVLGTSHQYSPRMFHLTAKDFASPLGNLSCDVEFVTKLASRHGVERAFEDEILHRKEHSLELQIPFLKFFRGQARIVPILVGSFHHLLTKERTPKEDEEYNSFASALSELVGEARKNGVRVSIIAGVDMAHVGQFFGDKDPLTPEFMEGISKRDAVYLKTIVNQDKESLFKHVQEDLDARRICGFPSMYLTIDLLDRMGIKYKSELLDYRQAVDFKSQCAVTFAGMAFFER